MLEARSEMSVCVWGGGGGVAKSSTASYLERTRISIFLCGAPLWAEVR